MKEGQTTRRAFLFGLLAPVAAAQAGAKKTAVVTGYCTCKACCGKWSDGITASGKRPKEGVTVAGPRKLPFGTKVHIEGVGWRVVQDRLAKRYDNRFDVFFSRHADARRFGIRKAQVKVQG